MDSDALVAPQFAQLQRRVDLLQRNHRMYGVLGMIFIALAVVASVAAQPVAPLLVSAQEFVIVDARGVVKARITSDTNFAGALRVEDADRRPMMALYRPADGSLIMRAYHADGRPVFNVTSMRGLMTTLNVSATDKAGLTLTSVADSSSLLSLAGPSGATGGFFLSKDGAQLTVKSGHGDQEVRLVSASSGSAVIVDGKSR